MTKSSSEKITDHLNPKEGPEREPKKAEYTFVLCEHTLQNVEAITKALKDCDIIALEWIGIPSEQAREEIEVALAIIAALKATEEDKGWAHEILSVYKNDYYEAVVFLEAVADAFKKSGKTIKLIDMTSEDSDFQLVEDYNAAADVVEASLQALRPNAEIKEKIKEHIHLLAATSTIREALMTQQLRLLGEQNMGANIGVMLGVVHIAVYNDISQEMPAKPVFVGVDTKEINGSLQARYSYIDIAAHAIQNGVEVESNPELIDRALLEEIITHTSFTRVKRFSKDIDNPNADTTDYPSETNSLNPQIIDHLTKDDVAALLEAIDKIKSVDRSEQHPLLASIQINNEIYMLLREAQTKYS